VVGDTVFAVGAVGYVWFVLGLKTGWSIASPATDLPAETEAGVGEPSVGASNR
jgi:hypothetical protein